MITGLVGVFSLVFKEWQASRDRRNIRQQALTEASAEVAFATEWWKAQALLGDDTGADAAERAREILAAAEAKVVATRNASMAARKPVTFRRLFLLQHLPRRVARVLRVLFWLSILGLVIDSLSTASDASTHNVELSTDLVMLLIFACAVLVLRRRVPRSVLTYPDRVVGGRVLVGICHVTTVPTPPDGRSISA